MPAMRFMCEKEGLVKSKCNLHYFVLEFLHLEAQLSEMQPKQTRNRKKDVLIINTPLLLCCIVLQSEADLSESEADLSEPKMQPKQTRSRKKGVLIINIALLLCCRVFIV